MVRISPHLPAGLAAIVAIFVTPAALRAGNVTIDGTASPIGKLQLQGPSYQIDSGLGKAAGANLLLSFSNFDIDRGETARFVSQQSFNNVIARVTGGTASTINGTVTCEIPGANLFLVNPAGLVIGNGAVFEVQGGLHLSTADFIAFSDGSRLSTRGGADPILSTTPPASFGFLSKPSSIALAGTTVRSPTQQDVRTPIVISITGGDLSLKGADLQAPAGAISLHAGGSAGEVSVPTIARPGVADFAEAGDVTMSLLAGAANPILTQLNAADSGAVRITGRHITLATATIAAGSAQTDGRAIELAASGAIVLTDSATVQAEAAGVGRGAAIALTGDSILVEKGSGIQSVRSAGDGARGSISLEARDITIRDVGTVVSTTRTPASGSSIALTSSGAILIDGVGRESFTGLFAQTESDAANAGRAGDVLLRAPSILIRAQGEVRNRTIGGGRAGNTFIDADSLTIDGQHLNFTGVESRAGIGSTGGSGGLLSVDVSGSIVLKDGGVLSATTFGAGRGGNVDIRAGSLTASGAGAEGFTGVYSRSAKAEKDGGRAGSVSVRAEEFIRVADTAQIAVTSNSTTSGAGDIVLAAPLIFVDHAQITADSASTGGSIAIGPVDTFVVTGGSDINANATGNGGFLDIAPAKVVVLGGSSTINAIARAESDVEVNIDATAAFIKTIDSTINARAPVVPPDVDVAAGLITFNTRFVDITKQVQDDCTRRAFIGFSTFTVESRGGFADMPLITPARSPSE
jgi:filamentous hemagglutinin family protein